MTSFPGMLAGAVLIGVVESITARSKAGLYGRVRAENTRVPKPF
jgi:hypothetical protein